MKFLLKGLDEENKGLVHVLLKDISIVGRDPHSEVVVTGPSVSSLHAIIEKSGNQFFVTDKKSTNGTSVNQIAVTNRTQFDPGDILSFGASKFLFAFEAEKIGEVIAFPESLRHTVFLNPEKIEEEIKDQKPMKLLFDIRKALDYAENQLVMCQVVLGAIANKVHSFMSGIVLRNNGQYRVISSKLKDRFISVENFKFSTTLLDQAILEGRVLFIKDVESEVSKPSMSVQEYGIQSILIAPLISQSNDFGGIVLWRDIGAAYRDDEVDWVSNIAGMLSSSLERHQFRMELKTFQESQQALSV